MKTLPIVLLAFLVGCATFDQNAGKTLASVAASVDAAMHGWATYVVTAKVSDADQAPVKAAYVKYQASMAAAEAAYIALVKSGSQPAWTAAKDALVASQSQLLALIQAFTTTTKGVTK